MAFKLGNPGCPCCDVEPPPPPSDSFSGSASSLISSLSSFLDCPCPNGNLKRVATSVVTEVSGVVDQAVTAFYTRTETGTAQCDTITSTGSLVGAQDSKLNGSYSWILWYRVGLFGQRVATAEEVAALSALTPSDINNCDTDAWNLYSWVLPQYTDTQLGMSGQVRFQGSRTRTDCAPNPDGGNTIDNLLLTYGGTQRLTGVSMQFTNSIIPIAQTYPNNVGTGTGDGGSSLGLTADDRIALGFATSGTTRIPVVTCDYTVDQVIKTLVDWEPTCSTVPNCANYSGTYTAPASGSWQGTTAIQSPVFKVTVNRL